MHSRDSFKYTAFPNLPTHLRQEARIPDGRIHVQGTQVVGRVSLTLASSRVAGDSVLVDLVQSGHLLLFQISQQMPSDTCFK